MINNKIQKTFEYIDGITVDDSLLLKSVTDILDAGLKSTWKQEERKSFNLDEQYNIKTSVYDQFEVQSEVVSAITKQLSFNIHPDHIRYQVLRAGIPKHTDAKRYGIINYIINAGGDNVVTKWYDSDDNVIETRVVEEKKWYKMKTDIDHTIEGMTSDRLMLSISLI
tara:strand:- start:473 stop:973 length:501 start_codon:yes stop_codon:yes gene_type:complete